MIKKAFILFFLLFGMVGVGNATIMNGGFELGDFTDWDVRIDSAIPPNQPEPAGTAEVVEGYGSLNPAQGKYFAELSAGTDNYTFQGRGIYVISLRQKIYIEKGDHLSGKVAFFNGDVIAQDSAWVKIYEDDKIKANPWFARSSDRSTGFGDVTLNGQKSYVPYGELWPLVSFDAPIDEIDAQFHHDPLVYDLSGTDEYWATWSWDVPKSAFYTLELAVVTGGDIDQKSTAFFDSNQVPEPSTMLLLSTGLIGLIGWRRKKFNKN